MIDSKKIEHFIRQMKQSLPKSIRDLGNNVEKKIRPVLKNQFNRMNLISREEFDMQIQVLLNTREKLNELETRLKFIENILKDNHDDIIHHTNILNTNKDITKEQKEQDSI